MMRELLNHLDELNIHIKNLDDEIDNFMKPEEKKASAAIQEVTGIGNTSAQAIISSGQTWAGFHQTDISVHGRDYAPMIMRAQKSGNPAKPGKGMPSYARH